MVIAGLCARRAGCESTEAVLGCGAMYDRCIGVIRYGDAYVNVARRGESSMMTAIFDDMSESEDESERWVRLGSSWSGCPKP